MKLTSRFRKYRITIARVLLLVFVSELSIPYALQANVTSPGSQGDYWGYHSPESNQLVGLSNGALNYTIPISSVPQYPMAIGYNSSGGLNNEAGMFGIGFNGFPGAINRSRMGLPDDLKGGKVSYKFATQKHWRGSIGVDATFSIFSKILGDDEVVERIKNNTQKVAFSLGAGGSIGFRNGYDNYSGMFSSIGLGLNIGISMTVFNRKNPREGSLFDAHAGPSGYLNISSNFDETGYRYNLGLSAAAGNLLSSYGSTLIPRMSTGITGNSDGVMDFYIDVNADIGMGRVNDNAILFNKTRSIFSGKKEDARIYLPANPNVFPSDIKSTYAALTVPIEPSGSVSATASFNIDNVGNETKHLTAYGFAHLKHASRDKQVDELTDFTIEREDSRAWRTGLNQLVHLQYDNFNISASGINGAFRYYHKEYGEVSRTTERVSTRSIDLGGAGFSSIRHETYPSDAVNKSTIKKGINILDLLKSDRDSDANDFDNFFYQHEKVLDLQSPDRTFGDAEFRMIGDAAGDFSSSLAPDLLKQEVKHIAGTERSLRGFFLGVEKQAPMYYPDLSGSAKAKVSQWESKMSAVGQEQSSNIRSYTIGELKQMTSNINLPSNCPITETFYNHYTVPGGTKPNQIKSGETILTPQALSSDLLNKDNKAYFDELIGGFEVENNDGLKYFFTLPVFEQKQRSLSISGKGKNAPVQTSSDYHSFSDKDRGKTEVTENFWYPYSWLLTAVVGPDYVDNDDIPGPSDGDLGYWVKFKYVKTSNSYQWRTPFSGVTHNVGEFEEHGDDRYTVGYGVKEVYYPIEIESSSHLTTFDLFKRLDGGEAKSYISGTPYSALTNGYVDNPSDQGCLTGDDFLYGVAATNLYKKHDSKNYSKTRNVDEPYKKIRTTSFKYDYSSWPGVYNNAAENSACNVNRDNSVLIDEDAALTGKLTLRSVKDVIYDDEGNANEFPEHYLSYHDAGITYNERLLDRWGNFNSNARVKGTSKGLYSGYTEVSAEKAKESAKAYKLESIVTPSGGEIQVEYGAKAYASVAGKLPYVMRGIKYAQKLDGETTQLKVDVSDIVELNDYDLQKAKGECPKLFSDSFQSIDVNSSGVGARSRHTALYGELGFYLESNNTANSLIRVQNDEGIYISNYGEIEADEEAGRYYMTIEIKKNPVGEDDEGGAPFFDAFAAYMLSESPHYKATKVGGENNARAFLSREESLQEDNLFQSIQQLIGNLGGLFKTKTNVKNQLQNVFGNIGASPMYGLSFLRTPIYKGKYTGSLVEQIRKIDHFNFSTDNVPNIYVSEYKYDDTFDGNGFANGVCTVEPGMGKALVTDLSTITGTGFHAAPAIYLNAVGVKDGVLAEEYKQMVSGTPRGKGITIHEFFTPEDSGLKYAQNLRSDAPTGEPKKSISDFVAFAIWTWIKIKIKITRWWKITLKIPFPLPLFSYYRQQREVFTKTTAFADKSDLYGKPKSVEVRGEEGNLVSRVTYNYFGAREKVPVAKGSYDNIKYIKPGAIEQSWGEVYEVKETKNKFAWLYLNASSRFKYVRTVVRTVHIPYQVKSIEYIDRNRKKTVYNEAFHEFTGEPIKMRTVFSDGTEKVVENYPAYWKYEDMKSSASGGTQQFNAIAKTITKIKLNGASEFEVIGSTGTVFHKDWKVADNYVMQKKYTATDAFHFEPKFVGESVFNNEYVIGDRAKSMSYNGELFPRHELYRQKGEYVPKVAVDPATGTYQNFVDFDEANLVSETDGWIPISSNNFYSAINSELVEAQDVELKYASKHQVAGQQIPLAITANAPLNYACFTGGEYYGYDANDELVLLDEPRIDVGRAVLFESCDEENTAFFIDKILDVSDLHQQSTNTFEADKVHIPNMVDGELFRAVVEYAHNGAVRVLVFEKIEDGTIKARSNMGEPFEGFFQLPDEDGAVDIYFKQDEFSRFDIISGKNLANAVYDDDFSMSWGDSYASCFSYKDYVVPAGTCVSSVHTGNSAFYLNPQDVGMIFRIPLTNYDHAVHAQVFEANVWVHKATESDFTLKASIVRNGHLLGGNHADVKLGEAAIETPEWKLMKLNFIIPPSGEYNPQSNDELVFYLDNNTNGIAIFDDFRVNPTGASWEGSVYNVANDRLEYKFDDNHFATMFLYDGYGRLSETRQEVENLGFVTIQKKRYGFQKN